MALGSIFVTRTSMLRCPALFLIGMGLASSVGAQNVYRFYESGATQQMVLAASEIAVKGKPNTSDASVNDAVRRHVPQAVTLEKWDRNYLVFIPPPYDVRNLTAKSGAMRQEVNIAESSPVLYLVQPAPVPGGKTPPPGDVRRRRLAAMRIVTKRAIANLGAAGTDVPRIQTLTGAQSAVPVGSGPWWLFTYETPGDALDAAYWMTETAKLQATPVLERLGSLKLTPNDTLYASQWHLNSSLYGINVTTAWDTRQGTGRHIALVDDGLPLAHPDLSANTYSVLSGNNYDFNGVDSDPNPEAGDDHGTAAAGLAAGRGNNSLGIAGVAFMAKLLGVRLLGGPNSDLDEQQAFTWKPLLTDVSSNSWGVPDFGDLVLGPGPLAIAGLQSAVTSGRGGRGVVFVFSGGNGGDIGEDSNYDGYANSRFGIGVGGTNDSGSVWAGSESGANIAVVAPAFQLVTTDRVGAEGYDPTDYTSTIRFLGTSGSAPIVAGAAALLIEANPNLGWRDVKEILMRSASRSNLFTGFDPFTANGAGIEFSHAAGAGRLDVGNALAMASTWTNLAAETSISSTQSPFAPIPDNNPNGVTTFFNMSALRAETVELIVDITHTYRGDLEFIITAPSGMQSRVRKHGLFDGNANFTNWTFTSVRHWGENASGTWTVKVADIEGLDVGTLNSVTLKIWGTPIVVGAPDLTITKTHTGNFLQGQTGATYTITVANSGTAATAGTVTVTDTLPAGLTATAISGTGWTCTAPAGPCSRSNSLAASASYPPIILTVNVAGNAAASVINTATVSGGGEANTANNSASDTTTIVAPAELLITSVTAPTSANAGGQMNVISNISNSGTGAAGTFRVQFYFSGSPTISTGAVDSGFGCTIGGLGASSSTTCNGSVNVPANLGTGTWYFGAVVDSNSQIPELNENNNARVADSGIITVTGAPGLRFVPVTPCRIIDTRLSAGPFGGPAVPGNSTRTVNVPQSACSIPANASAYSLNVTVVPLGSLGFLTLWPAGQAQPFVSTLNSLDGRVKANAAIVPAGTNGGVNVFVTNTTHVIIDINGYFLPPSGPSNLAFYPVTPCRISDTRLAAGPFGGPSMTAGQTRSFAIPSAACSIPPTAQAYSLNMTVVPSAPLNYLTTWPAGQPQPIVSTLNAPTAAVTANAAIVPAGTGGAINVFVSDPTHVIIDINGYFAPPGSPGELLFYSVNPCRVSDTRNAAGPLGGPPLVGGQSRNVPVNSGACALPSSARAYSVNATVVPNGPLIYLTLWPTGQAQPVVSTLNSFDATIVSNAAIVPAGTSGSVTTFVSNPTDLIVDTNGYFAP